MEKNKQNRQVIRVPVLDPEGNPLMQTTSARARKWIKSGKAIPKRNPAGIFYVQLTQPPSGYSFQDIQ